MEGSINTEDTMGTNQRLILLFVIALSGCSAVDVRPSFEAVSALVASRGVTHVHWRTGGEEDSRVDAQIASLLKKELSADEAIQVALLNNRNLQATYESLSIAQADLVSAGLLRNPIFDGEIRFPQGGGRAGLELSIAQDFIDVLFIPLRKRVAESALEAAKLRVGGSVLDLAAQVRAAFYTLQGAEQTLEMRQQVVQASEASYDLSKRLRAAENITELDVANERALYEQSKLELRTAELQVLRARERLNELMGLWGPQTGWRIARRLPELPGDEMPLKGLERKAVEQSLDLAVSRQQIEQAGTSLGLARPLALIPDAEIGASGERESEGEWTVGPSFSLPLPIFNQGQPAVVAAQATLRRALESYTAQAVTLRSRVRTAHAAVVTARDQANYYAKVLLPLRKRIVEQTQLQYNAMQIGPVQLINAKQEQINAGSAYIRHLREYWIARTELDLLLNGRMSTIGQVGAEEAPIVQAGASEGGH